MSAQALPRDGTRKVALLAVEIYFEFGGPFAGQLLLARCLEGGAYAAAITAVGGEGAFSIPKGEPGPLGDGELLDGSSAVLQAASDLAVMGVELGIGAAPRLDGALIHVGLGLGRVAVGGLGCSPGQEEQEGQRENDSAHERIGLLGRVGDVPFSAEIRRNGAA